MAVAVRSDQLSGTARALGRITPVAGQLRFLEDVGSARLITAVVAAGDAELTARWLAGADAPDADAVERLRAAFGAAWLLAHHLDCAAVAAWFRTRDPVLGSSPVLALRHGRNADVLPAATAAAAALGAPRLQPPYVGCDDHRALGLTG